MDTIIAASGPLILKRLLDALLVPLLFVLMRLLPPSQTYVAEYVSSPTTTIDDDFRFWVFAMLSFMSYTHIKHLLEGLEMMYGSKDKLWAKTTFALFLCTFWFSWWAKSVGRPNASALSMQGVYFVLTDGQRILATLLCLLVLGEHGVKVAREVYKMVVGKINGT
jgi:hypothetical protein